MTIRHHISDSLLMAYSAGQLPEAFSLVLATHLSLCDDCRARLGSYEAVGGAVMADCAETAMSDSSFDQTMARILQEAPRFAPEPPRSTRKGILPGHLRLQLRQVHLWQQGVALARPVGQACGMHRQQRPLELAHHDKALAQKGWWGGIQA